MNPVGTAVRRAVFASGAIVLSLSLASGARAGEAGSEDQRAADRVIERQVRRAIRADPSLAQAARFVKVTSRGGVVRLVGRVRTAKDRASIVFKAGQNAWDGRVDDRVTIGDGVGGAV